MHLMLSENTDSPLGGLRIDISTNMLTLIMAYRAPVSRRLVTFASTAYKEGGCQGTGPFRDQEICGSGKHISRAHRDGAIAQIVLRKYLNRRMELVYLKGDKPWVAQTNDRSGLTSMARGLQIRCKYALLCFRIEKRLLIRSSHTSSLCINSSTFFGAHQVLTRQIPVVPSLGRANTFVLTNQWT
jgi:hypothetical protein